LGVQYIDGPPQVKYWGVRGPCDPRGVDAYMIRRNSVSSR